MITNFSATKDRSKIAKRINCSAAGKPVTSGIPMGPGPGPEILGMQPAMQEKLSTALARMLPYDQTGEIEILYQQALARGN